METITTIIREEMGEFLKENFDVLGMPEVAEMLSRVDPNLTAEDLLGMLQQEYQNDGDEAVRKFFYDMSQGTDLQILGRGKYAIKFN